MGYCSIIDILQFKMIDIDPIDIVQVLFNWLLFHDSIDILPIILQFKMDYSPIFWIFSNLRWLILIQLILFNNCSINYCVIIIDIIPIILQFRMDYCSIKDILQFKMIDIDPIDIVQWLPHSDPGCCARAMAIP